MGVNPPIEFLPIKTIIKSIQEVSAFPKLSELKFEEYLKKMKGKLIPSSVSSNY